MSCCLFLCVAVFLCVSVCCLLLAARVPAVPVYLLRTSLRFLDQKRENLPANASMVVVVVVVVVLLFFCFDLI